MVTDDPVESKEAAGRGERVVLIVPPTALVPARPGSAVLVGDPADPDVRRAAAAMDAELHDRRATP
jgi:hypothetical protein